MIYLTVKIHFNFISSEFQIANYNAYTYICDGMLRIGSCVPDCELKKKLCRKVQIMNTYGKGFCVSTEFVKRSKNPKSKIPK